MRRGAAGWAWAGLDLHTILWTTPNPTTMPLLLACIAALLTACGTASYVEVVSVPPGAQIFVEGVDTGERTPAMIDLELHAPDPDRPMRIEVRRDGFLPTVSVPYPERHQCSLLVCEKKRRKYLPCHLAMFASGGGVRVETHYEDAMEVSFDHGPWLPVTGPSLWSEHSAGLTVPLAPGPHTMRYRPLLVEQRRSIGSDTWQITVPEAGYLALVLRWSPSQSIPTTPDTARGPVAVADGVDR